MLLISKFTAGILTAGLILFSCSPSRHNEKGVTAAMKYYDRLILKLDADAIAQLYTVDGNLGGIAIGRDSIRNFLSSFKNIKVLSQASTTSSIKMGRDTAIQKGNYTQTAVISGKDTVKVTGEYTARWQWITGDGWHIKQMITKPTN